MKKSATANHGGTKEFKRASADGNPERYFLRLFMAGAASRSRQALQLIVQRCEAEQAGNYDLEVIDIYQQPELAGKNQIIAAPTLLIERPLPARRFVGSITHRTDIFGGR